MALLLVLADDHGIPAMLEPRRRSIPDHLNCLWTLPDNDDDFRVRWANIKRAFTQSYLRHGGSALPVSENRAVHHERRVWQSRYWERRIRYEKDGYEHRDTIHLNPVKHGYVDDPKDWPWSSFHRHVRLGWLDPNWPGSSPVELPEIAG